MFKLLILPIIILFSVSSFAQIEKDFYEKAHRFYQQYVKEGKVAYEVIYNTPEDLNELVALASNIQIPKSDESNYKAFWINAYNLAVIKGVITNYPLSSPLDIKGFFDKTTYQISGQNLTLNAIENQKLRANLNDPRIHFVLVCGALGCPPIIDKAYTPDNVESLLNEQTSKALNNSEFIKVKSEKVLLSEIFKWYREDFGKSDVDILKFINRYRENKINLDLRIDYYPYNWKLNKQ